MRIRGRKRISQENKKTLNLYSALNRLSSLALSKAAPELTISQTLKEIRKIFGAKLCWIFLIEDDKINLKSVGDTKSRQALVKSELLGKLSPRILKRTYPIMCNRSGELYKKNRVLYRSLHGRNIDKFIAVPLKKDSKLIGILNVARDSSSPNFTKEDLKSLTLLGTMIVMTRLKRVEEESRRCQDFLRAIIDDIPNPIFIKDRKHRYVVLNQAVSDLTGYPRKKMLGKSDYDFFPKEQADYFWKRDEQVFRTGKIVDIPEEPITDKEGNTHYLHTKKARLRDSSGRITHLVGIIEDTTDRKKAEEKLKLFSHSVDSSVDGIAMGSLEDRITYVNETFAKMFGYSRKELIGKKIAFIYAQDQMPKLKKALKATMEVGWRGELMGKKKDGKLFPVAISASRVLDDEGKVIAVIASHTDITEHKRAEETLRESESKYRDLTEKMVDVIYTLDTKGNLTSVNEASQTVYGFDREEVIGKNFAKWIPKEKLPKAMAAFKQILRGEKVTTETVLLDKEGKLHDVEFSSTPIIKARKVVGTRGIIRDITERKLAEKALIRSERIARERARLLTDLRNLDGIDDILTRVCKAVRDSGLFERAVMTLHKPGGLIVYLGQVGLPQKVVERARQAPPIDDQLRARITSKKFRISDSFFIPAEAGVDFRKTGRHVPQKRRKLVGGDWQAGDELFVHLRDFSGKIMGYLSVDTPTDGCRPDIKIIEALEMLVEAGAARVREMEAQDALKRERDFSQSIIGTANSLIVCLDADAKITVFNQECERVTGYRREEVLGKRWPELFLPPDQYHPGLRSFANWVHSHARDQYEGSIITKSGEIRTILWSNTAIFGPGKKDMVAIAIGLDITERKQAERALQASEDKHRTLLENVPQKIFLKDKNSVYLSCNENFARDLKIKAEEIAGKTDYYFFPKELAEKYRADDRRIIELGTTEDIEESYIQDGKEVFVHTVKTPVKDEQGNLTGLLGIFWDITERKRMEKNQRESEKRYRSLFEDSPISLWEEDFSRVKRFIDSLRSKGVKDFKRYFENHPEAAANCAAMVKVIDVNNVSLELFKARSKEDLRHGLGSTFSEESYDAFREELVAIAQGKNMLETEAITQTLKGDKKHVIVRWSVAPGYEKTLSKVLVSIGDITEIKRAKEQNLLLETSKAISGTQKLDRVLKIATEKMGKALKADRCSVALFDKSRDSAALKQVFVKKGVPFPILQGKRTPPDSHFYQVKESIMRKGYLNIRNAEITSFPPSIRSYFRKAGIKFSLIIPLIVEKKLFGVFHIVSIEKFRNFTSEEISLAQTIANQVAVAVQNALLIEDLREKHSQIEEQSKTLEKQYHEQTILMKISRELSRSLNLNRILEIAAKEATQALQVDRGAVALAFPEEGYAEIRSIYVREEKPITHLIGYKLYPHQFPQAEEMFRKRKTIAVPNIYHLPDKSFAKKYFVKEGIKSAVFVPMLHGKKLVGFFVLSTMKDFKTFTREESKLAQTIADQVGVAIVNSMLLELVKQNEENLKRLNAQLLIVQEGERKKIAQELHDEVGQMLQLMKMNLDRIKKSLSSKPQELARVEDWLLDTKKLLADTIDEIRILTSELRPSMLDDFGLIPTLRWFVKNYTRRSDIKVSLKAKDRRLRFPPNIEVTLYRVTQEALTNVAKHAQATEASVLVSQKNFTALLSVRDNGVGFDAERALSHPTGMGLLNIKERVNLLGGSFEIISHPRKGTRINVTIPF